MEQLDKGSPGTLHPFKAGRCTELPGKRAPTCQGNWGPCSNRCPHAPPHPLPLGVLCCPLNKEAVSLPLLIQHCLLGGREGPGEGRGEGQRVSGRSATAPRISYPVTPFSRLHCTWSNRKSARWAMNPSSCTARRLASVSHSLCPSAPPCPHLWDKGHNHLTGGVRGWQVSRTVSVTQKAPPKSGFHPSPLPHSLTSQRSFTPSPPPNPLSDLQPRPTSLFSQLTQDLLSNSQNTALGYKPYETFDSICLCIYACITIDNMYCNYFTVLGRAPISNSSAHSHCEVGRTGACRWTEHRPLGEERDSAP